MHAAAVVRRMVDLGFMDLVGLVGFSIGNRLLGDCNVLMVRETGGMRP
jgi:hypothetical protein